MPRKKIKVKIQQVKPIPKMYYRIFQEDRDGQAIFDEMAGLFYDRPSYVKGDPHETAYREGQRSVVMFLIRKCGLANETSQQEETDG